MQQGLSNDTLCEELMVKAGPHFQSSGGYSNNFRTSCECRVARHETQRLHARYAKLLNVPVGSLEAARPSARLRLATCARITAG